MTLTIAIICLYVTAIILQNTLYQKGKAPLSVIRNPKYKKQLLIAVLTLMFAPFTLLAFYVKKTIHSLKNSTQNYFNKIVNLPYESPEKLKQQFKQVAIEIFKSHYNAMSSAYLHELWKDENFLKDDPRFSNFGITRGCEHRTFKRKYIFIHIDGYLCVVPLRALNPNDALNLFEKAIYYEPFSDIHRTISYL